MELKIDATFEGTLMGSFYPKQKIYELKIYRGRGGWGVKMKNDTKLEVEWTCHFKIDMKNLTHLDPST